MFWWKAVTVLHLLDVILGYILGGYLLKQNECMYSHAAMELNVRNMNVIVAIITQTTYFYHTDKMYTTTFGRNHFKSLRASFILAQPALFVFDVQNYQLIHLLLATVVLCGTIFIATYHVFVLDPMIQNPCWVSVHFRKFFVSIGYFYCMMFVLSYMFDVVWIACAGQWFFLTLCPFVEYSYTTFGDKNLSKLT